MALKMKYANSELVDTWTLLNQFYHSYGKLVALKLTNASRQRVLLEAKVGECRSLLMRALNRLLFEGDGAKSLIATKLKTPSFADETKELPAAVMPTVTAQNAQYLTPTAAHNLRRRTDHRLGPLLLSRHFRNALNTCTLFEDSMLRSSFNHARGFKTRSSGRIQSTSIKERSAEEKSLFRRVLNLALKPERQAAAEQSAAAVNDEALEKYLKGDPKLSENEQNRVKVAFLEGLVSGKYGGVSSAAGKGSNDSKSVGADGGGSVMSKTVINGLKSFLLFLITLGIILLMLTLLSNVASMRQLMGMSQHEIVAENVEVSFDDVRGCDEAKDELREIVEYLKNPERFSALGGRLPKGVLLIGPPGTGKTLLGRAVAGEAGVPFFHVAGSEFDEILVGQGARRVRDLFMSAKEKSPCVIFIDEIDAVGSKRTSSVIHPHANQTINQLLAEMDGFHQNEGVIVLGATNRREDLDKALTRPGRFDVEVHVPVPDLKGRTDIIAYYLAKIRTAPDVDAETLARGTTGFTGADLEAMINQAALKGASDSCTEVTMEYLEHSRDKVLMGPAKKNRIPDDEANRMTAFHEAGHTLVAYFTEHSMTLHKVTIIPRGMSLGHTAYIPDKETYQTTRAQLLAMVDTLLGGRAAEELIFGEKFVTSGASDDLRKASDIVRQMVKQFGMSERVGLRSFRNDDSEGSGVLIAQPDGSPQTQDIIDQEIRRILQESYDRAKAILTKHAKAHTDLAEALLSHETLDANQIKMIVEGRGANMPKIKRLL